MSIAKYCAPAVGDDHAQNIADHLQRLYGSFFESCPGAHDVDREHRILAIASKSRFDSKHKSCSFAVVFADDLGNFDVFKNQPYD